MPNRWAVSTSSRPLRRRRSGRPAHATAATRRKQRQFLDPRRGPFFGIGEARYFLASQDGRPVGRVSAHINRLHDAGHGPETGFFGFFESIPDRDVAAALFEAAPAWLRERGKTRLVGPLNFGIYDERGLLVEGFDSMPVMFQTHNPPYYQDLLTSLGFVKAMDWHAYKITNRQADLDAMQQRYDQIMRGQDIEIVTYNPKEVDRRADGVFHLFNTAWEPNWGHVPLTRRQFDDMLAMVKPCLRPEMAYVLLDGNRVAGFGIARKKDSATDCASEQRAQRGTLKNSVANEFEEIFR